MTKKKSSETTGPAPSVENTSETIAATSAANVSADPPSHQAVSASTQRRLGTGAIVGISAAGAVLLLGSAGVGFVAGVAVSHSPGHGIQQQFERVEFDGSSDGHQRSQPPEDMNGQMGGRGSQSDQNRNQQKNGSSSDSGTDSGTDTDSNSNSNSDTQSNS